jgi:hypothetical protein
MQQTINQWMENINNFYKLTSSAAQHQAQQNLAFISQCIQSYSNSQGKGGDSSQFSQWISETSSNAARHTQQTLANVSNWIQDCITCACEGGTRKTTKGTTA